MDQSKSGKARIYGPYLRIRTGKGGINVREYQVFSVGATSKRTASTFGSEREAEQYAAELRCQASDEASIEGALRSYEVHQRGKGNKPRGIERELERIRALLGANCALPRITPAYLCKRYDLRKVRVAVDSHRNELSTTKTFLRWADKRGLLRRGVLAGCLEVKGEGRRKKGKPQLRIDELRAWLDTAFQEAASAKPHRAEGAAIALCTLLIGLRAGEVLAIQARDIDDGGRLVWTAANCKTERSSNRPIKIPGVLRRILLQRKTGLGATEFLFGGHNRTYPTRCVRRICDAAGVPRTCAHALRGALATFSRELGMAGDLVAAILGHESSELTDTSYAGLEAARAGDRLAGLRTLLGFDSAKNTPHILSQSVAVVDIEANNTCNSELLH